MKMYNKFIVLNRKYLTEEQEKQILGIVSNSDMPNHFYYVVNTDEPYANTVKELISIYEENRELRNTFKENKDSFNDVCVNLLQKEQKLEKIKEIAQWHTTNADSEDVQSDMNDILQIIEGE